MPGDDRRVPWSGPPWLSGIEDALATHARVVCAALADDLRTHTSPQAAGRGARRACRCRFEVASADSSGRWPRSWRNSRSHADSVIDIARTLTAERGDERRRRSARLGGGRARIDREPSARRRAADAVGEARHSDATLHRVESKLWPETVLRATRSATLFDSIPTLADLPDRCEAAIGILTRRRTELAAKRQDAAARARSRESTRLLDALARSADAARALERRLTALGDIAGKMFDAMEFDFLFDPARQLLSIGYRVADGSLDPNCYDLLASEARLASFVAIAKGDVPARHWFRLGRDLTPVDRGSALISWSGSMFEYLMPSLVMRAPAGSLLEQTNRLVVRRQMKYGAELGVPWGVSESAYNARDLELTYQYSNFGVPGLGLKRGLSENTVIAPYATALAAMVDPKAAARNFSRLAAAGGLGRYGWYEALDYTPTRLPEGADSARSCAPTWRITRG